MNWKGGFWRLWILASALWVAYVGDQAWKEFSRNAPFSGNYQYVIQTKMPWLTDGKQPLYEIAYAPQEGKFPNEFVELESGYVESWENNVKDGGMVKLEFPDLTFLYLSSGWTKDDQNYLSKLFWEARFGRYSKKVGDWLFLAFGPPLIALFGGLAIRWVYLGFAGKKSIG